MTDYATFAIQDLRLVMLRTLATSHAFTSNETVLQMEAKNFGHNHSRDVIRNELRWLSGIGAVTLKGDDGFVVATLTRRGLDHVEGLADLDGVHRPSPRI